jgi:hypothetical protein
MTTPPSIEALAARVAEPERSRQADAVLIRALRQILNAGPLPRGPKVNERVGATAAPDFSAVTIRGRVYYFRGGQQREIVRCLWPSLDDGVGLTAEQLADRLGARRDTFRVRKLFRGHPAWGTLIRTDGRGRFWLAARLRRNSPDAPPAVPRRPGESEP